ncbi:MAG: 30S ribosomal protein S15 [Nanoarchaeota archaeon]
MPKLKQTIELKKPIWLKYTKEEIEDIILKLAEKGLTAEKIGLMLKNQYGIPRVRLYGLKIGKIMGGKFKEPTLANLEKKSKKIDEHVKKNKHDRKANRALTITKAKLKRIQSYISN